MSDKQKASKKKTMLNNAAEKHMFSTKTSKKSY